MTQQSDVTSLNADLAHFVLDDEVPCSWPAGCAETAVWWYEHTCGAVIYACESHRAKHESVRARMAKQGKRAGCRTCMKPAPVPVPWRAL